MFLLRLYNVLQLIVPVYRHSNGNVFTVSSNNWKGSDVLSYISISSIFKYSCELDWMLLWISQQLVVKEKWRDFSLFKIVVMDYPAAGPSLQHYRPRVKQFTGDHTYTTNYRNKPVNVGKIKHIYIVWELPTKSVLKHYKNMPCTSSID